MTTDRNFDDLAERFAEKIYGGLKGQIRLAIIDREIDVMLADLGHKKPLNVLDIGGGLGQHTIRIAQLGHKADFNELSTRLLHQAKSNAEASNVVNQIEWYEGSYQVLKISKASKDLILCHAVIEWLAKPHELFGFARDALTPGGMLSLSFYNPAAKEYRNLIRGNFDWLRSQREYHSDEGSLTPNSPCTIEQVEAWAEECDFEIKHRCGIRVFSDYVVERRGGLGSNEETLAMECEYSDKEPFWRLGRYLHFTLQKK